MRVGISVRYAGDELGFRGEINQLECEWDPGLRQKRLSGVY